MKPLEIKKDIYWVGAIDWNIRDFHGYSTYKGSTYNAFLVMDEKITLFDAVKKELFPELIRRIKQIVDPKKIDYLVVNHGEMDHTGSLPQVMQAIQPEKLFCSEMGHRSLLGHFHRPDWPFQAVKSGESISLGKRQVNFLETRMLHWPDSMFSYLPQDKLLISSDAFGQHYATTERFDDEADQYELMHQALKYYANILMPYSPLVQKLLAAVASMNLDIDMIAPDHGLIWRTDPSKIIKAYDTWSKQETKDKVLVVYDTMWHSTEKMAQAIVDGLRDGGVSAQSVELKVWHRSEVVTEMADTKGVIIGSPTLNNGMMPAVADFLTYIKGLKFANRIGASFGSYGWSGESANLIRDTMLDMKWQVVGEPWRQQWVPDEEQFHTGYQLGMKVAQAVKAAK